jgi:hypothetical protein
MTNHDQISLEEELLLEQGQLNSADQEVCGG